MFSCGTDWIFKHYLDLLRFYEVKEIISVYTDKHKELINTKWEFLIATTGGTYNYHSALR
jgi:hypothetical protein